MEFVRFVQKNVINFLSKLSIHDNDVEKETTNAILYRMTKSLKILYEKFTKSTSLSTLICFCVCVLAIERERNG